jgi:LuxR family maltose regulon positive regulatory protein
LLIVHDKPLQSSLSLLQRLLTAAQAGERVGRVIEIYWLQALTYGLQQEPTQALRYLEKALSLAEGANYVHLFVAEGWPAYQLLTLLSAKPTASISNEYIKTILAAFPQSIRQSRQTELLPQNALTKRELKTLQLLASELSFEAIAHEMSVSLSTVRTYAKRIYSKLAVHSRAEAVYQAKERKLL